MRRKDKEIDDRREIDAIIDRAEVCRLALARDNVPYVVPLCFGYDGRFLYFHSARTGMKIDILRKNPRACFEITPPDTEAKGDGPAGNRTMQYKSVIGFGTASFLEDLDSRREGLAVIFKHYAPGQPFQTEDNDIVKTAVICVDIVSITGKMSGQETKETVEGRSRE